ncbi:hypothetical protein AAVH_22099, partial [Aphelenchoides avenae]
YYFRQLVTLANYYDVKPLIKKCVEVATNSPDIPNTDYSWPSGLMTWYSK